MLYSVPVLDLILVAARMGGMIFTAPFFGSRNYPAPLRIGLMFFLAILINPLISSTVVYDVSTFLDLGAKIVSELMIGVFVGFVLTLYWNFIYFAGDIIDRDIGFSMVNVVNPMDESQIPITANLFYIFATLIFVQLDFHHELITAMTVSFERIPLGFSFFSVTSFPILLDALRETFVIGFQIAAPFVITVLISNIILGLLAKAMPGMNVFILGMPFKIFFGFLLFIILMPFYYEIFAEVIGHGFKYVTQFFNLFP
ncbi:flagellar biosynthetic protein FliR [Fusibacter tunisiensis]|jgi:flagellar biosynthetic protein FliR|uniref:Flagellar biosynthetic protein FliR n=1 Tax=Fusibacter tunisiensis TaxID=1008308 RepID=A0ABS2MMI3_9FIRM|nr:flagellar biosynthetic protein FliR [Fusibacter tunisiensis]